MLIKILIIVKLIIIIMVRVVLILAVRDNRKIDIHQLKTNTKCLTLNEMNGKRERIFRLHVRKK